MQLTVIIGYVVIEEDVVDVPRLLAEKERLGMLRAIVTKRDTGGCT